MPNAYGITRQMEMHSILERKPTCCGVPSCQKTANRTVLCWSDITDTEHNG